MRSQLDDGPPCWFFQTERPAAHGWALSRLVSGGHAPMSRRNLFLKFAVCFVATGFVVASVVADELIGVLSKVDVEGKKITVIEKDTDKEIEVKITDDTEQPTGKNKTGKVDLEKLETKVKKAQDSGKKVNVKVTHEKNVASKLEFPKGKGKKAQN
jgi:hypothetical protein